MRDKAKIVWTWLLGEVLVPLGIPVVFALVIILLWWTVDEKPKPANRNTVTEILGSILNDNISPWVLTVYALTLIGSTFNDLRERMSQHWRLAFWLGIAACVVAVYAGLIAVEQQEDPAWTPDRSVWALSTFMLLGAVALSGWGHYLGKRPEMKGAAAEGAAESHGGH